MRAALAKEYGRERRTRPEWRCLWYEEEVQGQEGTVALMGANLRE